MRQGRLMTSLCLGFAVLAALALLTMADAHAADDDHPVVEIDTTTGPVTVELDRAKAPITVANFLKYVDSGYYNNLVFHRVIPDFMIQGGGLTDTLKAKDDGLLDPIKNEAGNGLSNVRGTLAMARTGDPNSATSQFFINLTDNGVNGAQLDRNSRSAGYAVFGKVIGGMDTVDKIARVPTGQKRDARGMPYSDVPLKPIFIKSIKRKGKP